MQARSVGYSHQVALESQKLTVVLVPQEDVYVNFEKNSKIFAKRPPWYCTPFISALGKWRQEEISVWPYLL